MRSVRLSRRVHAPAGDVWAVLADFPHIASWNSGVVTSYSTSEASAGVGARRHCDLSPIGGLDETVQAWEPETRLVISIDEASRLPIRRGIATFELTPEGDATELVLNYDYEPKGATFARVFGPAIDRQLRRGFEGLIDDLEAAANA